MSRTCTLVKVGCAALLLPFVMTGAARASAERVLVQKVTRNKVVIVRANGAAYLIEKGLGCVSLSQHEGRQVVIDSPGRFLGIASRLLIPDVGQDCPILKAEEIKAPAKPASQSPRKRV